VIKNTGVAGMPQQLAQHCVPTECTDSVLSLTLDDQFSHLNAPSFVGRLEQAVQAQLGNEIKLIITIGKSATATPAQRAQQAIVDRQAKAEQSIFEDPLVQDFQRQFDAEVQAGSIRPLDEPPDGYYE
jgi:DNA polymerase-3 subunit gamma/tau